MIGVSRVICPLALTSLTACGGGGGTAGATLPTFADPSATGPTALTAASLESAARSTAGLTGMLNNTTDTYTAGGLTGGINDARTEVNLEGGEQVILTDAWTDFAVFFDATPTGQNRTIGVVGVATPGGEMPGGDVVTYTGTSQVTLQDGTSDYDLTGDATFVASFGSDTVTTP